MRSVVWTIGVSLVLFSMPSWAHKPIIVGAPQSSLEAPIQIDSIDISQVAYFEKTPQAPEIWLQLQANAGDNLFIQLGVPKIDRLKNLRPSMALIGPGLPQQELPFAIPEGDGALVFPTSDVAEAEIFEEPFTGTTSWQFPGHDIVLQESGTYYLVGYLPNDAEGKFWMVLGTREEFSFEDILSLPAITADVRIFHEVFPWGGIALIAPLLALIFSILSLLAFLKR